MAGTLLGSPWVVDAGGLLCLVGIVIALLPSRRVTARWIWLFRTVLVIMAVSIPVGQVLAHLRHG